MSEEKNDPRKKLTVSEEAMGELKAGTLTCAPLYNKNTAVTSKSHCIQGSVTDLASEKPKG